MKKYAVLVFLSAILAFTSLGQEASAASRFKDVPSTYWASKQIEYLSAKGIISGYNNGAFGLHDKVTRAQVAIIMSRALKLKTTNVADPGFGDVKKNFYAYKEIAAVTNAGIFPKSSRFEPNRAMTRGEMALALVKAFKLSGSYSGPIYDINQNTALFRAVDVMAANKITTIDERGRYLPNQQLTRVQFSVFLARAMDPKFRQLAVQRDFLAKAKNGQVGTCSIPYHHTKTIKMVNKKLGQPRDEFYWAGGFGQHYGGCIYYFEDDINPNAKMTAIEYLPYDPDLTLAKAQQVLGKPNAEWYDDIDGDGWTIYYDLGRYGVMMSAYEKHEPISIITFIGSSWF